ncbi:MAG TPA: hypothetical protein VKS21_06740, partial [Spirochaetota bacterium]|nr:hypothetical protein [Spirochaetota bacterium]
MKKIIIVLLAVNFLILSAMTFNEVCSAGDGSMPRAIAACDDITAVFYISNGANPLLVSTDGTLWSKIDETTSFPFYNLWTAGNELYYSDLEFSNVIRYSNEQALISVCPAPGMGNPNNWGASHGCEYGGYLYVSWYNPMTGCEIWRTTSPAESTSSWTRIVSNGFGNASQNEAYLYSFNGELYAFAYPDKVFKSSDGVNFVPVADVPDRIPQYGNYACAALGSHLYYLSRDKNVYRTTDGSSWTKVFDHTLVPDPPYNQIIDVFSIVELNSRLYVSLTVWHSGSTFRSTLINSTNGVDWEIMRHPSLDRSRAKMGDEIYAGVMNGKLYVAVPPEYNNGLVILEGTPDGTPNGPFFLGGTPGLTSINWYWYDNAFDEFGFHVVTGNLGTNIMGGVAANTTNWNEMSLDVN